MHSKSESLKFEYYLPVFKRLTISKDKDIKHALINEPFELASNYWKEKTEGVEFGGRDAWDSFYNYLLLIEKKIAAIVKEHSCYYWIHFYRRIGVSLSDKHRGNTDTSTLYHVRNILETAFIKFGDLKSIDDIAQSDSVNSNQILGGYFKRYWLSLLNRDKSLFKKYLKLLRLSKQWVITKFNANDFINIYRLEGLAYEYWWTTAKMRSIGKNIQVIPDNNKVLIEIRNEKIAWLINNYDERIKKNTFQTSEIGVGFFDDSINSFTSLFPSYNIQGKKFSELIKGIKLNLDFDFISNFKYSRVDLKSFMIAHEFVEDSFFSEKGFYLSNLVAIITAVANKWLFNIVSYDGDDRIIAIVNKYQRAYEVSNLVLEEYGQYLINILSSTNAINELKYGDIKKEHRKIIKYLTLTKDKQDSISLWTGGPRYLFIPYKNIYIVDLEPTFRILINLFYKVIYDQQLKGKIFENNFREAIISAGFNVLPVRKLKNLDGDRREVDAAVRIKDTLVICECRAMERPLDFEIGNVDTINQRNLYFDEKITQVLNLEKFIYKNPKGNNYDFSWLDNIISIVISPFIEWVWDYNDRLFLDKNTPRILSGYEAISFLNNISNLK